MNKARANSARSIRPIGMRLALLVLLLGTVRPAALADHFVSRRSELNGREVGVVESHQTDLFVITTSAGGLSPSKRAEVIAERLEQLAHVRNLSPRAFSIGYRNGEIILQQKGDTDQPSQILVTVDRRSAPDGDVERLAGWWLALLRDHLSLAQGREPIYTAGTPVGRALHRLYEALGRPTEPVDGRDIDRAFEDLSDADQRLLRSASSAVPSAFRLNKEADAVDDPGPDGPPRDRTNTEAPPEKAGRSEDPGISRTPSPRQPPGTALSKTSGDYQVRLLTDPKSISLDRPAALAFRLLRTTKPGGTRTVVTDATVRTWLSPVNSRPGPSRAAEFDEETGTYRVSGLEFTVPGEYTFSIGVLPEEADPFKVAFTFSPGLTNEPGAGDPGDTRKPADRAEPRKPTSTVKRAGDYTVTLTMEPDPPVVGGETHFTVTLARTKENTPVNDALLRIWTIAQKDGIDDLPTVKAEAEPDEGTYSWHSRFTTASVFVVSIWITMPDKERLQVEFPVTVRPRAGSPVGRPDEGEH